MDKYTVVQEWIYRDGIEVFSSMENAKEIAAELNRLDRELAAAPTPRYDQVRELKVWSLAQCQ